MAVRGPILQRRGGSRPPPAKTAASAFFSATGHRRHRARPRPVGRSPPFPARAIASAVSAPRPLLSLSSRTGAVPAPGGSFSGIIMNVSSPRRYLSVWLRRLATDRILRGRAAAPADLPLAIVGEIKNAHRLTALNDAAAALGLNVGTALADARAMYPGLAVETADPAADRFLLGAVADWCDRYTPLVGLDPPDGIVLDVTGCAHLFGGETDLCRDLLRRLAAQGFCCRIAVADTVGCAWAVARYGTPAVVPSVGIREILLPLPLAALRIAPDIAALLAETGLRQIANVIGLPRAPLAARFGAEFVRRLDQALGREDEPITPRLPVPAYMAERRFADPIALEADILGTIGRLGDQLGRLLEACGKGARRLQAALFRADGKVHRIELGTGAPVRDAARVRRLFAARLAAIGDAR